MTKPTLTYFDVQTSRGEECRLAFFIAGVPFTDERLTRPQWEERKATSPFGALPILTVEGRPPLAQSNAILRMIGSVHGLLPPEEWESARHEAVMCSVEEMRAKGYMLGGESSGHIIFREHSTTGDGLIAGLGVLAVVHRPQPMLVLAVGLGDRCDADAVAAMAKGAAERLDVVQREQILVRMARKDGIADFARGDFDRLKDAEMA